MPENPTLLLVHGAWHGSWCWDSLLPHLDGLDVRTVDLPSAGDGRSEPAGLHADAAVVRAAATAISGPVVVCGHSYGGAVVSQAVAGLDNVAHIVFLCAFVLAKGESVASIGGGTPPSWWDIRADGYVVPLNPGQVFYQDVSAADTTASIARLRPQSMTAFTDVLTEAAWESVPSTYVVCTEDEAIPPFAQRQMAARAGTVRELDTSHSPFLSRPELVAGLLFQAVDDA